MVITGETPDPRGRFGDRIILKKKNIYKGLFRPFFVVWGLNEMFLRVVLILMVPTLGFPFSGRVIQFKDGDTVVVDTGEGKLTCRLYGIDAPETGKVGSPAALGEGGDLELVSMVQYQAVEVELMAPGLTAGRWCGSGSVPYYVPFDGDMLPGLRADLTYRVALWLISVMVLR